MLAAPTLPSAATLLLVLSNSDIPRQVRSSLAFALDANGSNGDRTGGAVRCRAHAACRRAASISCSSPSPPQSPSSCRSERRMPARPHIASMDDWTPSPPLFGGCGRPVLSALLAFGSRRGVGHARIDATAVSTPPLPPSSSDSTCRPGATLGDEETAGGIVEVVPAAVEPVSPVPPQHRISWSSALSQLGEGCATSSRSTPPAAPFPWAAPRGEKRAEGLRLGG